MNKRRRLSLTALITCLWATAALAQSPFPQRDGYVANGSTYALSNARLNREFEERIHRPYGLEGLLLVVTSCLPDPEVYLDRALEHYGLASAPGQLKNRALVLLVCQEPRFVGLYYGADNPYAARLDQDGTTAIVVEHLAAGDFTGALAAGIDRLARDLASGPRLSPAEDVPAGTEGRLPRTGVEATPGAEGAAGSTRGQRGWLWPVVLAATALAAWIGRRRSRAQTQSGTGGPVLLESDLRAKMSELERELRPGSEAFSRLVLAYGALGDEAVLELNRRHSRMLERLAELQRQCEALTSGVVTAAMADSQEELAARYAPVLAEADALLEYVRGLRNEADRVAAWLDQAPVMLVSSRTAIQRAREACGEQFARLGLPDAAGIFRWVEQLADESEVALTAGDRMTAGRLAEAASALAERLVHAAESLEAAQQAVRRAADRFAAAQEHAPASWSDVRGNGSEAEESLATAKHQLERMGAAQAPEFGKDLASGLAASLDVVEAEIARAEKLAASVAQRFDALEKARADATEALADVRSQVVAARAWLSQPAVDADVDCRPVEALDRTAAQIEAVEAAMQETAPDWPALVRQLQEARRSVDEALAQGRAQQERVFALQRELATAANEAESAISRAERFMEAHAADISAEARAKLEQAQAAHRLGRDEERRANASQDEERVTALRLAIDALAEATDLANSAYQAMVRDFRVAEERREPHRPRWEWAGPTVPLPTPGPSWGRLWRERPSGPVVLPPAPGRWGGQPRPAQPGGGESSRRGGGRGW